jgi:hypothetical protein
MKDVPAIIADIIRSRRGERMHAQALDAEIDRFVAEYEAEKTVIDVAHRQALIEAHGERERAKLWRAYKKRICVLQDKVLADVEANSVSVLHDVMPAVMLAH